MKVLVKKENNGNLLNSCRQHMALFITVIEELNVWL